MFLLTVLLATASGGRQQEGEEEELPNGDKEKAVADLPPTVALPFLPISNSSTPPQSKTSLMSFTIPSVVLAPVTPSEKG